MRTYNYIGNPPMFHSRVSGVGSQRPFTTEEMRNLCERYGNSMYCDQSTRAAVCHKESPPGTCKPVDWTPPAATPDAPDKPAKLAGSALPLVIGAALLLLS